MMALTIFLFGALLVLLAAFIVLARRIAAMRDQASEIVAARGAADALRQPAFARITEVEAALDAATWVIGTIGEALDDASEDNERLLRKVHAQWRAAPIAAGQR